MAGAVKLGFNAVVEGVSRESDRVGPTYGLLQLDVPKGVSALRTRRGDFHLGAYTLDFLSLARCVGEPIAPIEYMRIQSIGCCEGEAVVRRVDMRDDYYLGLAGLPGAGKSRIAKYIAHRFGMRHLVCSDVIKEELAVEGITPTRESMQKKGEELRAAYGRDIVVKKLLGNAVGAAVFDGIRDLGEAVTIQRLGGDVIIVHCDEKVRYNRLDVRDGQQTRERLRCADSAPVERGVGLIYDVLRPRFVIDNTGHENPVNNRVELLVSALLHRAEIKEREVHIDRPSMVVMDDGRVFLPEDTHWGKEHMMEGLPARVGVARNILFGEHGAVA